jgi:phosphate transport system substrate-binding protein
MIISQAFVRRVTIFIGAVFLSFLSACNSKPSKADETNTSGTIHISIDESFKPVMDAQVEVFESSWPNAPITNRRQTVSRI